MQSKDPSSTLLFHALWSEKHHHCLSTGDPATRKFSHIAVSSTLHASEIVLRSTKSALNVYFAPASFKSSDSRKAKNSIGASSLWMDIDVGPEKTSTGKGYATIEEASAALVNFCVSIGIPQPTHVVHSGTGIQVYWSLDTLLPKDQWQPLSCKLKTLCTQYSLLADACRTADIVGLMRVPGTMNQKYSPPRPATLEKASPEPIPADIMVEAIEAAFNRLPQRDPTPACTFEPDEKPIDLAICVVALRCLDPDMIYGEWFRVAAAIFNYSKGDESAYQVFDDWSSLGQKYKGPIDTLKLWNSLNPDCPNPITLGTLRWMIEQAGYNWDQDVVAVADMEVQV